MVNIDPLFLTKTAKNHIITRKELSDFTQCMSPTFDPFVGYFDLIYQTIKNCVKIFRKALLKVFDDVSTFG